MDEFLRESGVDLVPQVVDVDVDEVCAGVKVVVPDVLGNDTAAQDAILVSEKILEQCVFLHGEIDGPAGALCPMCHGVEFEIGNLQESRLVGPSSPQQRADTCKQFNDCKWLREVIVGPAIKSGNFVLGGGFRRKHQDRGRSSVGTKRLCQLQAVLLRKHDIQNHEVVRFRLDHHHAPLTVKRHVDGVVLFLQCLLDEPGNLFFVFDDQDTHVVVSLRGGALFDAREIHDCPRVGFERKVKHFGKSCKECPSLILIENSVYFPSLDLWKESMRLPVLFALASALLFSGCIHTIAVSTVGGIVEEGFSAFTEEADLDFAEKALPGSLKLLEVMLKNDPDNVRMLRLASEAYSSYALAFVEDRDAERARLFYERGRDFGLRMLRQDSELAKAIDGTADDLQAVLGTRGKDDVPAVFWTAFGWGSAIALSMTDPNALADLPKTQVMMEFVARADSEFYFGGADVFLGTVDGTRPKIFGGDPDRSVRHFERALRINKGKFLMTYVYYARSVAVQTQNQGLFGGLLEKVENASLDVLPDFRLANAVAKKKAQLLRAKESELF